MQLYPENEGMSSSSLHNLAMKEAVRDYYYLATRDYPPKMLKKLIGDRYALSGKERNLLFRGVVKSETAGLRRGRLLTKESVNQQVIHIDGYNVLYTLSSYLTGELLFISMDGLLRDASGIHGRRIRTAHMEEVLLILTDSLKRLNPGTINLYLDLPVSQSKTTLYLARDILRQLPAQVHMDLFDSVDQMLIQVQSGIIATSDSTIIDRSQVKVFDLARYCLEERFGAGFTKLGDWIKETK